MPSNPRGPAGLYDRHYRGAGPGPAAASGVGATLSWSPPTNVYDTDSGAIVQVEVAGLAPGDFRVSVVDQSVVVSGRRSQRSLPVCRACHQIEIAMGRFRSEVVLPAAVDDRAAQVEYRDGFITVILPWRGARGGQ